MGNRIMRHAVKEGFQHQGENLKSSFLADIRFQWQLHICNNSKHVQSIQLTLKSPYWLDHKYAILTSIMQGKKFHALMPKSCSYSSDRNLHQRKILFCYRIKQTVYIFAYCWVYELRRAAYSWPLGALKTDFYHIPVK